MSTHNLIHNRSRSTTTMEELIKLLLRYTIMAPSSHNTQPWKFRVTEDQIQIYADFNRWLAVADADRRELYISVGCALENLLLAAHTFRYRCKVTYFPDPSQEDWVADVKLKNDPDLHDEESMALFSYVMRRRTYHHRFQTQPIEKKVQERLKAWAYPDGVDLYLVEDVEHKHKIEELIVQGDAIQFADPDFRQELGYWVGQSVFGTSWLISKMGQ